MTAAAKNNRIHAINTSVVLGFGPRLGEAVAELVKVLYPDDQLRRHSPAPNNAVCAAYFCLVSAAAAGGSTDGSDGYYLGCAAVCWAVYPALSSGPIPVAFVQVIQSLMNAISGADIQGQADWVVRELLYPGGNGDSDWRWAGRCWRVTQGIFRNPLADPGLIGVSSGAALAAVAVIVLSNSCWPFGSS